MTNSFAQFLRKFPKQELPISITEDSALEFSRENDHLSQMMVAENIIPYEEDEPDDLTEYVPCFSIANLNEYHAIVYWRAGLLNYQFILATFDLKGNFIDKRAIAGTFSDGQLVINSLARIDADKTIYIMSGQTGDKRGLYDASHSKSIELEMLPDGKIVEL